MENATSNGMCNDNQDPDYQLFNSSECHQNIFEKNARSTAAKKISNIIEAEFTREINNKKAEVYKIFKELSKACKMLHYLRFAIVSDFYNQENTLIDPKALKQSRLHPTVNAVTKNVPALDINFANNCLQELHQEIKRKRKIEIEPVEAKKKCLQSTNTEVKLCKSDIPEISFTIAGNCKTKRRIIVGNISKWIPPDLRGNNASHKWTVYIRDSDKRDLGQIISKVRFFLHPSYKPNDVVELISPPFHLARFGWGEFPIRIQLYFCNGIDKPVDIIHYLKLDRTFTGLQTIGSETVIDLWITVKGISTIPIEKKTEEQEIIMSDVKEENSLDLHNEELKITNENKTSSQSISVYTDHDYIVTNVEYNVEDPSYHSKKAEEFENHTAHNSQNANNKIQTSLLHNSEKINLGPNLNENSRTLLKINYRTVSLPKQNELPAKLELNGNITINNEVNLSCFNNHFNLLDYSDDDSKKLYLKNSKSISSEQNSKTFVSLINHMKPGSLYSMLKFVTRRMPLITEKSTDPYYKLLYPYSSESLEVFINYLSGKQKSLERYRAMSALEVMNNTNCYNYTCTVKEFIIWARRYCYTPCLDLKTLHKICTSSETVKLKDNEEKYKYSATLSDETKKWLKQCHNVCPSIKNNERKDDDEIDIVNISASASNIVSMKPNSKTKNNSLIYLEYPETQNILNEYVRRTSQKIGIKLTSEEIIPGVVHSSATVLITKVVECLVDELTRVAFACSLDKCKTNENIISISPDDVRMALLKREEFEIFTNAGLGSDG